jgi:hypothetical protein
MWLMWQLDRAAMAYAELPAALLQKHRALLLQKELLTLSLLNSEL